MLVHRRVLPALVLSGVVGATAVAQAVPAGTTTLLVSSGANTSGVDAALVPAGSIAGTVELANSGGQAVPFASVTAFLKGKPVTTTETATDGTYLLAGLGASTRGYAVCVDGTTASGGPSTTGYGRRCFSDARYNGTAPPTTATLVSLSDGQQQTGIDITLPAAAAVSGTVTSAGGVALPNVSVLVRNRTSGVTSFGITSRKGAYTITNLTPSANGYAVCFNPRGVRVGTGFLPLCFDKIAWAGGKFPKQVTPVKVTAGQTTPDINGALKRGGAIAGRIVNARTHHGLTSGVEVFSAAGKSLASVESNRNGRYVVKGLAPTATGDIVCALPFQPSAKFSYPGGCWRSQPWSGGALPTGTTAVPVVVGRIHRNVNFALTRHRRKLGSIAGTITEDASGAPIQGATVEVFSPNGNDQEVLTDASGHYRMGGLTHSLSGYQVCVQPSTGTSATPTPDTGWSPACYDATPWAGPGDTPSGTLIPLKRGQAKTGVDIAVKVGGEISGAVTDAGTQQPVGGVDVELFDPNGHMLISVLSSFTDGSYSFPGLSPTSLGYAVCFDGRHAVLGSSGYLPQCFHDVAWDGMS